MWPMSETANQNAACFRKKQLIFARLKDLLADGSLCDGRRALKLGEIAFLLCYERPHTTSTRNAACTVIVQVIVNNLLLI
jgi:hypothetical protein